MNFCYVNLTSNEGEATLLTGGTFLEKLQFGLVKRRVRGLVDNVVMAVFRDMKFDIDQIIASVAVSKKELWDVALVYMIVRHIASLPPEKATASSENRVGAVLSLYLDLVRAERLASVEVLDLKLQVIRLKCAYDLDFAAERFRRSMQ